MSIKKGVHIPTEDDLKDGITYDLHGRMQYHPDFHPNHGKPFTDDDLEYLCAFYGKDQTRTLSFALGKTERTIRSKMDTLRERGEIEFYRERFFEKITGEE